MAFVDDENETNDLGFEAEKVEKKVDVYPAGDYPFVVSKAKIGWNPDGDIKRAEFELTITNGPLERRKLFVRAAIATTRKGRMLDSGEDSMACMVRIGKEQVGQLFRAVGVGGSDISATIGKEAIARVVVKPAKGIYDESNEVKKFIPKAGTKPTAAKGEAAKPAASKPAFMKAKAPKIEPVEDDDSPGPDYTAEAAED